ncbi:MAG: TetR/AcrR family transcriptional regulator [Gemmatimonadaceae bacterium]
MLDTAGRLIAAGRTPSIADVADAADISRRTAYRYFPTQDQLLVESALEALRPMIVDAVEGDDQAMPGDVEARLDRTVQAIQRSAVANEPLLRTMIGLTIKAAPPVAPTVRSRQRRGTRRLDWIDLALAPVRAQLGRRRYERLVAAMAVCVGIESLIVLRDICGLSEIEAEGVTRWAARTLLRASLGDLTATRVSGAAPPQRSSRTGKLSSRRSPRAKKLRARE